MNYSRMLPNFNTRILFSLLFFSIGIHFGYAQPGQMSPGGNSSRMNVGHFYGKVVNEEGKAVPYATVAIVKQKQDTIANEIKEELINGQITDEKGEFNLEKLPVYGEFTLRVSYLGYSDIEKKVSFGLNTGKKGGAPGARRSGGGSSFNPAAMRGMNFDVDLGNIALLEEAAVLDEVVVNANKTNVVIALDKKIYRVDQDVTAEGGTAQDALRNVPSLSVDLDGNIALRNGSPQIFVDGRPTTLSLDQIPSDDIESVEIITNPSAKYDASGGQAGIVNIVLKKNIKLGYNGSVRGGGDSQLGYNLGGNINVREGKLNMFANGFLTAFRGDRFLTTERTNLFSTPTSYTLQESQSQRIGSFGRGRLGMDWFMDNRNTLTFEGSFVSGNFGGPQELLVSNDFTGDGNYLFQYDRFSDNRRLFRNIGASALFKHLYPKKGRELTADLNYNRIIFENDGTFETNYASGDFAFQEQRGNGGTGIITLQADYVDPLTDNIKLEAGVRGSSRSVSNNNYNFIKTNQSEDLQQLFTPFDEFLYTDNVFAAYSTISQKVGTWSYQVGLRAESSFYTGEIGNGESFTNNFPISLFPSLFITKEINETDNIQFSVSRRVQRPNFFQLIPFTDYTDSLNLRRGNPNLIPEFTNSVELSYQNIINNNHNILVTAYYKRANNLITGFQIAEIDEVTNRTSLINTYSNSNNSQAYGVEFTVRNQLGKAVDISSNINVYNSRVDASNIEEDLINEQLSWFIKENINIVLPNNFKVQLSGQYQSRTAYSLANRSRFRGPGGSGNSAQGFSIPFWFADFAISKSILKRKGNISLNVRDIFGTRITGRYAESTAFIDETRRRGNFRVVRVNLSYRFGQTDMSIFRRKNMKFNDAGSDMMGN